MPALSFCRGSMKRKDTQDVLRHSSERANRSTVLRHYKKWREREGLPPRRCDNPKCKFHTEQLIWNGEQLPLILDHIDGDSFDHSPGNLRFLCPNCDSQLHTRGGKNRGRVIRNTKNSTIVLSREGVPNYKYIGYVEL